MIPSLRLLYWRPSAAALVRTRALLPMAEFYNHETGDGAFRLIQKSDYARALQGARVGLCLSDHEGPMRASVEYQLLDLPVVTTEAQGGRIEMMDPAHCRVVPADPRAVADAVQELAAEEIPAGAVRASVLSRLAAHRAALPGLIRPHLQAAFDDASAGVTLDDIGKVDLWRTRDAEVIRREVDAMPV
ncbi:hypothetical protein roselon_02135 [Roseibacterium elongatum DSM 19469]|uniref:Uncharacterized protein n=1 Tax=Roseicyclus elongatus DSM 19469 TaxID=1294273 RepID=W8SPP7_9RHOB|nr:hypothetical protein [Roseibacterium elongatum]AHM04480.1 hypothetical protein roselon_02135 [Roseibacterium elongatum DSM 19469]